MLMLKTITRINFNKDGNDGAYRELSSEYYILYIIYYILLDTLTVNKNTIGGMVWNGRELSSKDLNKPFVKTRLKLRA